MSVKKQNLRGLAVQALSEIVTNGRSLDTALKPVVDLKLDARDQGLVQEITYGCLRQYFSLDELAQSLLQKPFKKKDQDVLLLLLVGLYQIREMNIPPHAAVAETVAATGQLGKPWAKSVINACLRNFLRREGEDCGLPRSEPARWNHPQWLIDSLKRDRPGAWQQILVGNGQRPPMHLRVNLLRTTREVMLQQLADAGINAQPLPTPCGIVLDQPCQVEKLPGFAEGLLSVQDLSAQFAALLLAPAAGEYVLDACAAPGGKTAHLLELEPASSLLAVELSAARAQRIEQNLRRLGLQAEIRIADAADTGSWWDGRIFDRILLDAPCSATGVIRRHPDIKLLRRETDIEDLVHTQRRLLAAEWPLLKRGGKLLYVTCSVLAAENENQILHFLDQQTDARETPLSLDGAMVCRHGLQTLPGEGDGFYFCCLEKI